MTGNGNEANLELWFAARRLVDQKRDKWWTSPWRFPKAVMDLFKESELHVMSLWKSVQ